MRADIIEAAKKAYASTGNALTLGSVLADGECDPEPIVPDSNRDDATGTGSSPAPPEPERRERSS